MHASSRHASVDKLHARVSCQRITIITLLLLLECPPCTNAYGTDTNTRREPFGCWNLIYDHHNQLTTFPTELCVCVRRRTHQNHDMSATTRTMPATETTETKTVSATGNLRFRHSARTLSTVLHEFPPARDDTQIQSTTAIRTYVYGCCCLPLTLDERHGVGVTLRIDGDGDGAREFMLEPLCYELRPNIHIFGSVFTAATVHELCEQISEYKHCVSIDRFVSNCRHPTNKQTYYIM